MRTKARSTDVPQTATRKKSMPLSLAEQIFAIVTKSYVSSAKEFLPNQKQANTRNKAIEAYQQDKKMAMQNLTWITEPIVSIKQKILQFSIFRHIAVAAVSLLIVGATVWVWHSLTSEMIELFDDHGQNALNRDIDAGDTDVSLRVLNRKRSIGEIKIEPGSRIRIVKATNSDMFRSELHFSGNSAEIRLRTKGKASVLIKNGPFHARVRVPESKDKEVRLRLSEEKIDGMPPANPTFSIEVIQGNVHIAEIDDAENILPFGKGEKAIFTETLPDRESL